jgi:hypothetical protein
LGRLGYDYHDTRYVDLPSGRGCGEQWVRERYSQQVAAYRARSARAETALVVAIDANGGDIQRRIHQLSDALAFANLSARTAAERIVHLIPKRNIETWVRNLNGAVIDEDVDYTRDLDIDRLLAPAATKLFEWTRANVILPSYCAPSLKAAIPELRRLE